MSGGDDPRSAPATEHEGQRAAYRPVSSRILRHAGYDPGPDDRIWSKRSELHVIRAEHDRLAGGALRTQQPVEGVRADQGAASRPCESRAVEPHGIAGIVRVRERGEEGIDKRGCRRQVWR